MTEGPPTRGVGSTEKAQLHGGTARWASTSATRYSRPVPVPPPSTHDQPCVACGHGPHHFLDCECGCSLPLRPGLDTALYGTA